MELDGSNVGTLLKLDEFFDHTGFMQPLLVSLHELTAQMLIAVQNCPQGSFKWLPTLIPSKNFRGAVHRRRGGPTTY